MNIAVIVPAYNVAPYLRRCVDSIRAQTHRDFSLILVDDGSTDDSGTICDEYAAQDTRVRAIHQSNGGLSAARNTALDLLERENTATHVTFVDSDDWVAPNYLEELVRGLSDGAEISAVRCVRTSDDSVDWKTDEPTVWRTVSPREFWPEPDNTPSAAWGKLYPFGLFKGVRYPVGKINEDEFTTYRLFFKTTRIACAESALYAYYSRPDSIMNAAWSERRLDRLDAWRNQIRFFEDIGFHELVAKSRQCLSEDLVDDVRHLRERGDGLLSKRLRKELAALLKRGKLPIKENYLAYKTAHPMRTRIMKLMGMI